MHNGRFRLLEIIVLMCVASFRVMIFFCRNIAKIISRIKSIIAIYAQPNVRQPSSDSEK